MSRQRGKGRPVGVRYDEGLAVRAILGLAELTAKAAPHECPFCGEAQKVRTGCGRDPATCGSPECRTAWHRYYGRDRRRREREAKQAKQGAAVNYAVRVGALEALAEKGARR